MKNLFVAMVIQGLKDEEGKFNSAPLLQDLSFTYGILKFYTDIEVDEDNLVDLYNGSRGSGLFDKVIAVIPQKEINLLQNLIDKSIIIEKEKDNIVNTIKSFLFNIVEKLPDAENMPQVLNAFVETMKQASPTLGISGKTKLKDLIQR
jgi:hypothetical protein